jgi:hypothetical protein
MTLLFTSAISDEVERNTRGDKAPEAPIRQITEEFDKFVPRKRASRRTSGKSAQDTLQPQAITCWRQIKK